MNPSRNTQDINRCNVCISSVVQHYCDFCHVSLCKSCIGEHISDGYDNHKIVSFQQRGVTLKFPKCQTHSNKICELQCIQCGEYLCAKCYASDIHKGHDFIVLEDAFNTKEFDFKKDINEIETIFIPTYVEIRHDLENKIVKLDGEYMKLMAAVTKHGEEWHREIDSAISNLKNEINKMKAKHRKVLVDHLDEIKQLESLVRENLSTLTYLGELKNVSATIKYKSRNKEFCKFPPKVQVIMPTFCYDSVDKERISKLFGFIKPLTTKQNKYGYKLKIPMAPLRKLLDCPEVISTFITGFKYLRSISAYSEQEIWTSAKVNEIKCFDSRGKFKKSAATISGEWPRDIVITGGGNLVYCDCRSVYKITYNQRKKIVEFQGWTPINIAETFAGDYLVVIYNDEKTQSKIVRYSESVELQTIQYNEEGLSLYSGNNYMKFIAENRNLDICVADSIAGAVVVVNQVGELRFYYTGHPSEPKKEQFHPYGIATNSQSQILISDRHNHCVHILDQDGQHLRYIENVNNPCGLCVYKFDHLFVTDFLYGIVKVIKYMK